MLFTYCFGVFNYLDKFRFFIINKVKSQYMHKRKNGRYLLTNRIPYGFQSSEKSSVIYTKNTTIMWKEVGFIVLTHVVLYFEIMKDP